MSSDLCRGHVNSLSCERWSEFNISYGAVLKISLEHSDAGGTLTKTQKIREASVEVFQHEDRKEAFLSIAFKPKDLVIPLNPPVTLYGNRLGHGQLGLRFLKFYQNPWDKTHHKTLQVTISTQDIDGLTKMHRCIMESLKKRMMKGAKENLAFGRAGCTRMTNTTARPLQLKSAFNPNRQISPPRIGLKDKYTNKLNEWKNQKDEELPSLSAEQSRVFDLVLQGKSVFFTGSAGTGKSLLLKHIIKALPSLSTFVTGTTGLAGSLLGGMTIHAFAGIGKGEGNIESLSRLAGQGESGLRWRRAKTLIIDEISMMDGKIFDTLESIAREVRGSKAPFGGIQVILSGDFCQLPPVCRKNSDDRKFCFEALSWSSCIDVCVELKTVFRQADDVFIDLLSEVRAGRMTQSKIAFELSQCTRALNIDDGILPTRLFTHRIDVNALNETELQKLNGRMVIFEAQDSGDKTLLETTCAAPQRLPLKEGAQVMLTRNKSSRKGLVNGSRGVVEKISSGGTVYVRFASHDDPIIIEREKYTVSAGGRVLAERRQLPLSLSWGITIHKSQGMSLDRVEVSLEKAFEPGMAYVALSRAKTLEGLRIIGNISSHSLRADPKVLDFYSKLKKIAV